MKNRPPDCGRPIRTLVELLSDRADGRCADRGFTFFRGDDLEDEWLRYRDLHRSAQKIAIWINERLSGQAEKPFGSREISGIPSRVIILCSPGPSYLRALFGTLYSGLIAVTAYPPRARRRDHRLDVVIEDSQSCLALVDQTIFDRREQILASSPALRNLQWMNVDALPEISNSTWASPDVMPDDLAILQYTSGSTSDPKGVCLTHRNLLSNLQMIYDVFEIEKFRDQWSVTWLPPYHDMGLIGGLFQVMYAGECSHVMPPAAFVQNPIRWLRAITKYKATISGGPNFSFDTCVRRISATDRASLDLTSWKLAFCGAEPIREKSLRQFVDAFSIVGFHSSSFFPCYGLAEATLIVSGGPRNRAPKLYPSPNSVSGGSPTTGAGVVSCGTVVPEQQVRIVDPKTCVAVQDGLEGEIWVAGDNVSPGYWRKPRVSDQVFRLGLAGESARFMRTGDLGILHDNELYVSGRLKELIVIRGRNFQPSDIESAIADCSPLLVANASAAFEMDCDEGTGLSIVHEVDRNGDDELRDVALRIRARVVEGFELEPSCILLIPKRALPKTSSGKVQRLEAKRSYENGSLIKSSLYCWTAESGDVPRVNQDDPPGMVRNADEITNWLTRRLATQLQIDSTMIDHARPFSQYGLDSVSAVQIASELQSYIGRSIPATLMYEAPTIEAVAKKLTNVDSVRTKPVAGARRSLPNDQLESSKDVAIIGVACRLPGCDSPEEFWRLLRSGQCSVIDPPEERSDCVSNRVTTKRAGWVSRPDLFDASLFGISPREAKLVDPQHRWLLETSWRAIEDSGIDPMKLSGSRTGVFVGISNCDYERRVNRQNSERSTYSMTGNAVSMASHRISYHFDLRGPSLAVDTACSSSLVALHQAVRSIQVGDCDAAIVAGVNLILSPEVSETLSDAQMLSPDGLCKTFDATANGYVRGEGCVAILIKPLHNAIRDRSPIQAVIRGSAINQDGLTNGITAPNGDSQSQLYRDALADAGLQPEDITLLEAHGTGTPLGDPIEVHGLHRVYGARSDTSDRCILGAVKANVGHLEAAAGLTSLLKVVLALKHRETVPQPHLDVINPHIDLTDSRLVISQRDATSQGDRWDTTRTRMAAVSSFGLGGTNAHVIIAESPIDGKEKGEPTDNQKSSSSLITLSAAHPDALRKSSADFVSTVQGCADLASLAKATQKQKTSHRHRVSIVGHCRDSIADQLWKFSVQRDSEKIHRSTIPTDRPPLIAFMFSGQGGQHIGMGRELYQCSVTFRDWVDRCDALLMREFDYRIADVIASDPDAIALDGDRILSGPGSQTSLFVLQLALAKTLEDWGIRSVAVTGHSMGEYAAAVTAQVMDWKDALRLTAMRAKEIAALEVSGAMTVVFDSVQAVRRHIRGRENQLSIAAVDGPQHVVVSGSTQNIGNFEQTLETQGVMTRPLRISQAFHSNLIEPVLPSIAAAVSGFKLNSPQQTYISTLTGSTVSDELRSSDYWMKHSRDPVLFVDALDTLQEASCDLVIEIGPTPMLCALGQLNSRIELNYLPTLVRGGDAWHAMMETLAELFVRGTTVRWDKINPDVSDRSSMVLPGYPFQQKRFWIDEPLPRHEEAGFPDHPQLTTQMLLERVSVKRGVTEAGVQEESGTREEQLDEYSAAMAEVDELVPRYMSHALQSMGFGRQRGDQISISAIVQQGGASKSHRRLLERILDILVRDGVLKREEYSGEPTWIVIEKMGTPASELAGRIERLLDRFPIARAEIEMVGRCGTALPDVLRGDRGALSVLFPDGDPSGLESLYRASPLASCSNRLVAEAVSAIVDLHSKNDVRRTSGLRVLEIGAGTGGTTRAVLSEIRDRIRSYDFTDISPLLINDSAKRFEADPKIEFRSLDIEMPPSQQGFDEGSYDIVIAANVFHATRDLRKSLKYARRLLCENGFLVTLEGIRPERFLDMVFGLTEGWWHFTDTDLRPAYPLIDQHQWLDVISGCGFSSPVALPYPDGEMLAASSHAVFVASVDSEGVRTDHIASTSASVGQHPADVGLSRAAETLEPWIDRFRRAAVDDHAQVLEEYFRQAVSIVLGHEPTELDLDQPVSNLGIDSLMALQLKNRVETDLDLSIPMIAFLDGKSVRQLIGVALADGSESQADGSESQVDDSEGLADGSEGPDVSPGAPVEDAQRSVNLAAGKSVLGPLSEGQQALWIIHRRAPQSPAYNFAFAARSPDALDHESLSIACRMLIDRHPVLRTCYRMEGISPVRVLIDGAAKVNQRDCCDWSENRIIQWLRKDADRPFDLENGPVIRFTHLQCRAGDVLSISIHHIAADLWSMDILVRELTQLYETVLDGKRKEDRRPVQLVPLPTTFDAHVRWERDLLQGKEGTRLWKYWEKKLQDANHTLSLPTTYRRPPQQTFNGSAIDCPLSDDLVDRLRSVARNQQTTLFTVLLSCYQVFLSRICGQDDLLVGTVSANRGRSDWEGIVGYLLNNLVIRAKVDGTSTFRDVVQRTRQEVLESLDHHEYPFAKLVEKICPERDATRSPLVQTMFIWDKPRKFEESGPTTGATMPRLHLDPLLLEQRGAPFDLTLVVFELENSINLSFRYNTDLFSRESVEHLAGSLRMLVHAVAENPELSIGSIPLLTVAQRDLIDLSNQTDVAFDEKHSGYALFASFVNDTPNAIAVESKERSLCYAEVAAGATRVANSLLRRSVKPGEVVALLVPRGVDAIIGILGIWKAGAAYLPLDPDHPTARLQAVCDDAMPTAMLFSDAADRQHDLVVACPRVDIYESTRKTRDQGLDQDVSVEIDPDAPAYVIYTSGSTGQPKGVVLAHRGLANLAVAQRDAFGVGPHDRCLQFASLGFDASVFEIVMAFHAGATLFILDSGVLRSTTTDIAAALREARVSVATLPPPLLSAIDSTDLPDLRTLVSAGDVCSEALVKKWSEGRRMFNAYGPTETTVWATNQLCEADQSDPPIGRAIANVRAHVLDRHLELAPVGVAGELCISGPGLATEYINLPEETSERFLPNPYSDRFDATMYRTGDRVRWNCDGQLEFLGRIDEQVKIDGNRVEPGEIASVIRRVEGVADAVVIPVPISGTCHLAAYLVFDRTSGPLNMGFDQVRDELKRRLPCSMIPKHFLSLEHLPLTVSGKPDVARLPTPSITRQRDVSEGAKEASATETALLEIWCDVLQRSDITIEDNFFDLGGASLQALQAADLATKRGFELSAERMFQFQTIFELAREIDAVGLPSDSRPPDVKGPTAAATRDSVSDPKKAPNRSLKMVIESIGMYLPPDVESTDEIIRACRNRLDFPLERMTGIKSRHMAGREEFSIDLARKAAVACLERSRFDPADIDTLIACNISRYDGPDFEISYEPSTASRLKHHIGASNAFAFDLCNACAGFFTALSVAESKLINGESRRVMIVSGEYITHLTRTAQLEIDGFLDPRLACLTLGDAGVAMIVELTNNGSGFQSLDLYTSGRHHDLCVAKATDRKHGGAIMLTDAIKATAVTLDHSLRHAHRVVESSDWSAEGIQHVVMHQTSGTTINGAIDELNRHFERPICSSHNTVNNLRRRGNTATTTHWVAVMDMIRQGRINEGDRAVFAISGSGQTIGTALYQFDNLPDRMNSSHVLTPMPASIEATPAKKFGIRIVDATVDLTGHRVDDFDPRFSSHFVVESAASATEHCLQTVGWKPDDVEMLLHCGVYRDEFLSEPAVAAIVAGELGMNADRPDDASRQTLAFDVTDAGCGTLMAMDILKSMIRSGKISRGIVTASEIENNPPGDHRREIVEMGSAIAFEKTPDPNRGLGDVFTRSYPKFASKLSTKTELRHGQPTLVINRAGDLQETLIQCVIDCLNEYLNCIDGEIASYQRILLSVPSTVESCIVAEKLGIAADRVIVPTSDGDAFTSGLAVLWRTMAESAPILEDTKWLLVSVGAGIEVGCVEYRH